jgi:alkylation response protein AidB-like acyl-CoA dehydrogenase
VAAQGWEGDGTAPSQRAALAAAAQLIGLAKRMTEMTVEYANVRQQFGKPIGSFQAVKHHLVDAHAATEMARPLVLRAAWSLSVGASDAAFAVSMAKAAASDAAELSAKKALQVHGAIGYTTECDLHFFLKRTWALARAHGSASWHREQVAAALLDGPAAPAFC